MIERIIPSSLVRAKKSDYFPARPLQFISSGSTLLNCALTGRADGGWVLCRVANVVGDKSVGKSLLAIEACANFAQQFPKGLIWYREAEAAFDLPYAQNLGLPVERVDFGPQGNDTAWDTIEAVSADLNACIEKSLETGRPGLYIIDSLDALSSEAEMARKPGQGTFGVEKPKFLSQMFRKGLVRRLRDANVFLLVISQIRDKINATFGAKYERAGGKALDFYASHVVYLSQIEKIFQTVRGVRLATGVRIKAQVTKNKIALPFRECEFIIRFGYGIDELEADFDYLEKVKRIEKLGIKASEADKYFNQCEKLPDIEYRAKLKEIGQVVEEVWQEVEMGFKPKHSKYG